jgi:exosortase
MTSGPRLPRLLAFGAVIAIFLMLYVRVFADLVGIWLENENYSHGALVAAVIAYLVWARRTHLAAEAIRPSNVGLAIVAASLGVLLIGTAGVEFFLMRTSAVGVIAGSIVFLFGWGWLRQLMFPLGLTALIIPVPPVIFYQATFPLQIYATKFGVAALELLRIPVLREGNVIELAHTTLEVTEACSGIRSLVSLLALSVLWGYFADSRAISRVLITASSIPIAIISNGLRIAGTGIAAQYWGASMATGFFHSFSGWVVFMTSFAMLIVVANAVKRLPSPRGFASNPGWSLS